MKTGMQITPTAARTSRVRVLLAGVALCGASLGASAAAQDNTLLIDDAVVFDGERTLGKRDILIEDGRIAKVARRIRAKDGVTVVDADGVYAMPGLIDAHVHAFMGQASRDALRFGVTTQLDQFTSPDFLRAEAANREETSRTDKADFYSAGFLVTSEGGHGTQFGLPVPTIERPEEAEEAVAERLAGGSDWIKIVYEPGWDRMTSLDRETMAATIAAAQEAGALAVVHVTEYEAARAALEAGADGLVHIFSDEAPDAAFVELAEDSGAFIIATLAVTEAVTGAKPGQDAAADERLSAFLSPQQESQLAAAFPPGAGDTRPNRAADAVRLLHEAGVPILAGSDAPNPGTTYGASMHTELKLLTEAGLSPEEALGAGTAKAADAFGIGDRGRIAKGQKADILLLRADPSMDIGATRDIAAVYKNGYAIDRAPGSAAAKAEPALDGGMIADFEDGFSTGYGVPIVQTTDAIAGGNSAVTLSRVERPGGGQAARAEGAVKEGFGSPWSGLGIFLSFDGTRSADWSAYEQLRFMGRGMPRDYTLMLFTEATPQMPATARFSLGEDWGPVAVSLSDVAGADLSAVFGMAITAGAPAGAFFFEIDDLRLD